MKCADCGRPLDAPWGMQREPEKEIWCCDYGHPPRIMCGVCAANHPCPDWRIVTASPGNRKGHDHVRERPR